MTTFFNGVMEISKIAKTVKTLNLAKKRTLPKLEQIYDILKSFTPKTKSFKGNECNFEDDSLFYRKPVKIFEQRSNMIMLQ